MNEERILPYSYHTFVYPFSFEDIGKLNINDVCKWKQEPFELQDKGFDSKLKNASKEVKEKYRLQYNAYQYFFPKAQKNMFNVKNSEDISTLYEYILNKEDSTFTISKWNKNIELRIEAVRVNIFTKLQVGVLSFELEYYPTKEQDHFADALFINAFGRRLFPPYIMQEEALPTADRIDKPVLPTADKIEVVLIAGENEKRKSQKIEVDYRNKNNKLNDEPTLIRKILTDSKDENVIIPILDDRMFVISLIRDDQLSDSNDLKLIWSNFKKLPGEKEGYPSISEKIYKFLFIDEDDCTCQNDEMLMHKLQEHLYTRWINYGTIHGITEYSMVCVTGTSEGIVNSVINPFLVHYTEMVKLALIQRASLVKLETEVSKICTLMSYEKDSRENKKGKENKDGNSEQSTSKNTQDIWKDYILFQNQILLPEVTFQEQGVEMYQMLKKNLKIEEMNEYIGSELNNLHEMSNMENSEAEKKASEKLNQSLNLLAVLGTIIALIGLAQDYFGQNIESLILNNPPAESALQHLKLLVLNVVKYFAGFLIILGLIAIGYQIFKKISDKECDKKGKIGLTVSVIAFWIIVLLVPFLMAI